jgi:hypothetical protein
MKALMMKHPSAFLPMMMSLVALALVLGHLAVNGVGREADEGTSAHLFQILMAVQLPVIAFFVLKWLPRAPRQALQVLALQLGVALAPLAALFFMEHE